MFGFRLARLSAARGALCQAVAFSSVVMMRYQFVNFALGLFSTMKVFLCISKAKHKCRFFLLKQIYKPGQIDSTQNMYKRNT
jgi:hypothetical protein